MTCAAQACFVLLVRLWDVSPRLWEVSSKMWEMSSGAKKLPQCEASVPPGGRVQWEQLFLVGLWEVSSSWGKYTTWWPVWLAVLWNDTEPTVEKRHTYCGEFVWNCSPRDLIPIHLVSEDIVRKKKIKANYPQAQWVASKMLKLILFVTRLTRAFGWTGPVTSGGSLWVLMVLGVSF